MICPICAGNPINPKDLEEFIKEMAEITIPAIVECMKQRAIAANDNRHKILLEPANG